MYKIIMVEHDRCSEVEKSEFYMVPSSWTEEEIGAKLDKAVKDHIADAKKLQESNQDVYTNVWIENAPEHLTVKEAQEWVDKENVRRSFARIELQRLSKTFDYRLALMGFKSIYSYCREQDKEKQCVFTAMWGHNHGLTLKY